MNPADAFLDVLNRLLGQLRPRSNVGVAKIRRGIRAFVGAWFGSYRDQFVEMLGIESPLIPIDGHMQALLTIVGDEFTKTHLRNSVLQIKRTFSDDVLMPASRAYWSRAPERSPAGLDEEVLLKLGRLDPELGNSYSQVVSDLEDGERLTYRGPASELREVLTSVLHKLAPTADVEASEPYKLRKAAAVAKKEPVTPPTRAERVRFIFRSRGTSSETAESYVEMVEDRLALVVNATYGRGSAQAHAGAEADEVLQQLRYVNALLRDLLPR